MRSVNLVKTTKTSYVIVSLAFCVMGVLLIAMPKHIVSMLVWVLGVLSVLFGIVKIAGYFSKDLFRLAFQYDLASGLLLLVLGVITIWRPDNLMVFIHVAHGIYVLMDGLLKVQIALDSKAFGIKSWWLILVMAVAAGIIGCLLIICPAKGVKVLIVLLGCCLLAEGILNLITVLLVVRIIRHQQPNRIEAAD